MILHFKKEFETKCTPCGHHWKHGDFIQPSGCHYKHGETLLKCKFIEPDGLRVQNIISFNSLEANKTVVFLCKLADEHNITITGNAKPNIVGPSITGQKNFASGLSSERLLKWYKYYGFKVEEINGVTHVKRSPKNETQS